MSQCSGTLCNLIANLKRELTFDRTFNAKVVRLVSQVLGSWPTSGRVLWGKEASCRYILIITNGWTKAT
jgi:hypothetical protein